MILNSLYQLLSVIFFNQMLNIKKQDEENCAGMHFALNSETVIWYVSGYIPDMRCFIEFLAVRKNLAE